jgi:hypothetical protein
MKDELAVFVRIALYALAGRLTAGGWLPADIAAMLPSPDVVQAVTGALIGVGTLLWYRVSAARKALVAAPAGSADDIKRISREYKDALERLVDK